MMKWRTVLRAGGKTLGMINNLREFVQRIEDTQNAPACIHHKDRGNKSLAVYG